jgi:hypothetical protein
LPSNLKHKKKFLAFLPPFIDKTTRDGKIGNKTGFSLVLFQKWALAPLLPPPVQTKTINSHIPNNKKVTSISIDTRNYIYIYPIIDKVLKYIYIIVPVYI